MCDEVLYVVVDEVPLVSIGRVRWWFEEGRHVVCESVYGDVRV